MKKEKIEELFEHIWLLREEGKDSVDKLKEELKEHGFKVEKGEMEFNKIFEKLKIDGFLKVEGGKVLLTEKGETLAEQVTRRHRLAERLLVDLLQVSEEEAESSACVFEHILSPEVADSICSLLGHPPLCPHGKPIPRGECCKRSEIEVKPVVNRLSDLSVGSNAKIVFTTPSYHKRFDRLIVLGISPGSILKLHQKHPSFVIRIGETEIALDKEIADEIFVKKLFG